MRNPDTALKIGRLKRRADFLHVAKGKRWHAKAMTVQAAGSDAGDQEMGAQELGRDVRIGFTLTRKVGNAVVRNRARRRLKEAVRLAQDLPVDADHDYVIVGRIDAVHLPFDQLQTDLARAFAAVRAKRAAPSGRRLKVEPNTNPRRETRNAVRSETQ